MYSWPSLGSNICILWGSETCCSDSDWSLAGPISPAVNMHLQYLMNSTCGYLVQLEIWFQQMPVLSHTVFQWMGASSSAIEGGQYVPTPYRRQSTRVKFYFTGQWWQLEYVAFYVCRMRLYSVMCVRIFMIQKVHSEWNLSLKMTACCLCQGICTQRQLIPLIARRWSL